MSIRVGLSTASCYPLSTAAAFRIAAELGYDGVEVMVWTEPASQDARALRELSERHGVPILSIHAPTLLLTQRVMGNEPWGKIDRSVAAQAAKDLKIDDPTATAAKTDGADEGDENAA